MQYSFIPGVSGLLLLVLVAWYFARHRGHSPDVYVPLASWLRAGIYFCFCYLVAWYSGALPAALASPIYTAEQAADPLWWVWVVGLSVFITVAYWLIWARLTRQFGRRLNVLPQLLFGIAWGLAAGFLFLAFWHLAASAFPGLPTWATYLVSYACISIWQWLFQDYGWDVWVSPEHDCPWSIAVKVPTTHIPNVTLCLIFFALYGNYWIFVGLQTWALVGASLAMRMPAPWEQAPTPPARRAEGLFGAGLPRAAGYLAPRVEDCCRVARGQSPCAEAARLIDREGGRQHG